MDKFLLVLNGETFRSPSLFDGKIYWGSGRKRGIKDSFKSIERQYIASKSQMQLVSEIEKKYNLSCDILINSYKSQDYLDTKLIELYSPKLISINLQSVVSLSEESHHEDTIHKIMDLNFNNYKFILFLRLDFYIRPFFMDYFYISDEKIIYAYVDSNTNNKCSAQLCSQFHHENYEGNTFPKVCQLITFIPKKHYNLLIDKIAWNGHASANNVCKHIDKNNIDLYIKTYHYTDSCTEWNPLYCMVDRTESKDFYNLNYRFDIESGKKIEVENDNIYLDMINKDNIIDKLENL